MAIDKIDSGALDTNIDVSGSVTADSLNLNAGYGSDAAVYGVRAWAKFSGTTVNGSGNVSSITNSSTGIYQVNFTSNLPDTNYSAVSTSQAGGGSGNKGPYIQSGSYATSSVTIYIYNSSGSLVASDPISVTIVR